MTTKSAPRQFSCTHDTELSLLLPAKLIPDQAIVTKPTGQKRYTLRDRLTVYTAKETLTLPQELTAPTASFIVDEQGYITLIDGDTVLRWHLTAAELYEQLDTALFQETAQ